MVNASSPSPSPPSSPTAPAVTSPTSLKQQEASRLEVERRSRNRSACHSFVTNEDLVVMFSWNGEPIDLELVRMKTTQPTKVIRWHDDTLGVTFGIEETSRKIIVTKTLRDDVKVGDVLVSARGEEITETNFDEKMASLKLAHGISRGIPFEFNSPPPPVYVKGCSGLLKKSGVDASFELRTVAGKVVRYLSLNELNAFIKQSTKPCEMVFVQRRENQYLSLLRRQAQEDATAAAALAAAAAICAVTIC